MTYIKGFRIAGIDKLPLAARWVPMQNGKWKN